MMFKNGDKVFLAYRDRLFKPDWGNGRLVWTVGEYDPNSNMGAPWIHFQNRDDHYFQYGNFAAAFLPLCGLGKALWNLNEND